MESIRSNTYAKFEHNCISGFLKICDIKHTDLLIYDQDRIRYWFTGMRKLFVNLFYGGIRNTFDVQSRKTKNRVVEFGSKKMNMFDFV